MSSNKLVWIQRLIIVMVIRLASMCCEMYCLVSLADMHRPNLKDS